MSTLQQHWWRPQPSGLARVLQPLSGLYRTLFVLDRARHGAPQHAPVFTIVVGNLVVGGAGKTPVVIALVNALKAEGRRPAVISRGYGRDGHATVVVKRDSTPNDVGDEPLLIHLRTQVPVWVSTDRLAVARALCAEHPEVDVIVSDDGLQHHRLQPDFSIVVFDARGAGNGLLLPAGPLREPLARASAPDTTVLYSDEPAQRPVAGLAAPRSATTALPFDAWKAADARRALPIEALAGRPLTALAGIGAPHKFFSLLRSKGLNFEPLAQADHARYDGPLPPWPATCREVITTEKDAVKLQATWTLDTAVWVVPLDCELPPALTQALLHRLQDAPRTLPTPPHARHTHEAP